MNTNFFNCFKSLSVNGQFRLVIQVEEQEMMVSILFEKTEQGTLTNFPPLTFKKLSPETLDAEFFKEVTKPLQHAQATLINRAAFEKAVEKVVNTEPSKPVTKKSSSTTSQPTSNTPPKFTAAMAKVAELEKLGKIGQAIGALPKVNEFPAQQKEIEEKLTVLKSKHGGFTSLFDEKDNSNVETPPDAQQQRQPTASPVPTRPSDPDELVGEDETEDDGEDWESSYNDENDEEQEHETFMQH